LTKSFQFIHAADIHLDSPLSGLAQYDESAAQELLIASRAALENLVQLALDKSVAFVVIAGDLYDGDWRDYQTGLFLLEQLVRLQQADIPVYILHGNHDAESKITRSLPFPDNVHTFSADMAESFTLKEHAVCLHGRSFPQPAVHDNLVPDYPAPTPDHFNIGVLHTALEGSSAHANYAPCTLTELENKGYDYWALGHVHEHAIRCEDPYIVYPGNLQGRNIRETGPKGACLITVEDHQVAEVVHVPLDVARWARVPVKVSADSTFADVVDLMGERIREAVVEHADDRLLACRIELVGCAAVHGELKARIDDLRQQAIGITLLDGGGTAWIEKVKVLTTPAADAAALAERQDALGELFRALPEAAEDEVFKAELTAIFHDLRSALPHKVRDEAEDELLRAALDDDFDQLLTGVRDELLSDLMRSGGDG